MTTIVQDVMTPDPITVQPQTPLQDAIKILAERHISGLPVLDESETIVGILSETDLMWRESGVEPPAYFMFLDSVIYLQNPSRHDKELHKALGQTVGEVMSDKPLTIKPKQSLREAAKLMHEKNIRRLPVIDEQNKVIGILTQGDIIQHMAME